MEVGMALAIKTLADDFQPLSEVYKSFIDEALMAEDLGFDYISHQRAPLRGRRLVAVAAADPGEHRRAHLAHPVAHERVLAAVASSAACRRRRGDGRHLVEWSARPRVRHRLGRGGVRRVRRRPQDAVEPVLGGDGDPPPRRRLPSHSRSKASTSRSRGLFARPRSPCNSRSRCGWVVSVRSCSTTRACAGSTPRAVRSSVPSTSKG